MPRLTQYERRLIRHKLMRFHQVELAQRKAVQMIEAAQYNHLPPLAQRIVKGGHSDWLRKYGVHFEAFLLWVPIFEATDLAALKNDKALAKRVRSVYPKHVREYSCFRERSAITNELRQFTTHKQLLDAHPELAALMPDAETPEPVSAEGRKLRRKLLAAGWPLQVRRDA